MSTEKNRPCYEKRVGAIRLAIFENAAGDSGKQWWNCSILRTYRDASGEWHETPTFNGEGDLAQVAWAVSCAMDWLRTRQNGGTNHQHDEQ